jgi:homoserine dehydrogenase
MPLIEPNLHISRFYLRFQIPDRPGQLAHLARILGENGISIASVIQHEPESNATDPGWVPLIIMTHQASCGAMQSALSLIRQTCDLHGEPVVLEVEGRSS